MSYSYRRRTWLTFLAALDASTKIGITVSCFVLSYFVIRMLVTLAYTLAG